MNKSDYKKARKKVKAKKKFYQHLSTYLVFCVFFFLLNYFTGEGWWFYWPILGWGIGVALNYINVFGLPGFPTDDPDWEEMEMEKELEKINRKKYSSLEEPQEGLELDDLPEQKAVPQTRQPGEDELV